MITAAVIVCASVIVAVSLIILISHLIKKNKDAASQSSDVSYNDTSILDEFDEFAGVWIASVFNIDFPSAADLSADELKAELDSIVATAEDAGLNTIFFQVRPEADALYKSEIFPVSRYMSSTGELTFDALEYIIYAAHQKGIAVHAWVNPLRVSSSSSVTLESLPDGHPAKENPHWVVQYADGKMYFDAGNPEVRELVVRGVEEIVENYNVDGIVFDDYFYPYPAYETSSGESKVVPFDDADTYSAYGNGASLENWRRENINTMVKAVFNAIKAKRERCLFGVSPFGIWKNGYGDESGSLSSGSESYSMLYCDTVAWIKGGYVDYVAPQLYWTKDEQSASFNALCDWWNMTVKGTGVRLLISHAAYRYEDGWNEPSGIMTDQVTYAREKEYYRGSIFYGYDELKNNISGIKDELKGLYKK